MDIKHRAEADLPVQPPVTNSGPSANAVDKLTRSGHVVPVIVAAPACQGISDFPPCDLQALSNSNLSFPAP